MPRVPSGPGASSTVTRFSQAAAPSLPGQAALNRPFSSVTPVAMYSAPNPWIIGVNVTTALASGWPLSSTTPETGTICGGFFWQPANRRAAAQPATAPRIERVMGPPGSRGGNDLAAGSGGQGLVGGQVAGAGQTQEPDRPVAEEEVRPVGVPAAERRHPGVLGE